MLNDFTEPKVNRQDYYCSLGLLKPHLTKVYNQTKHLPERMQTYGYIVLEPYDEGVLILGSYFHDNIIPEEYVNEFFRDTQSYENNCTGAASFLFERNTAFPIKKWNDYAVYIGGYSYHGKLLIVGQQENKGYKALSFPDVVEIILNIELVAGYRQIEFHQLSPTSYMS